MDHEDCLRWILIRDVVQFRRARNFKCEREVSDLSSAGNTCLVYGLSLLLFPIIFS